MADHKTVNEVPLHYPHKRFEIDNDAQAQQFMVEFGLSANIKADVTTSGTQLLTHSEHKTHHFVILYFTGKDRATDNGYLINCLPKSEFIPAKLAEFVAALGSVHTGLISVSPINTKSATN